MGFISIVQTLVLLSIRKMVPQAELSHFNFHWAQQPFLIQELRLRAMLKESQAEPSKGFICATLLSSRLMDFTRMDCKKYLPGVWGKGPLPDEARRARVHCIQSCLFRTLGHSRTFSFRLAGKLATCPSSSLTKALLAFASNFLGVLRHPAL